MQYVKNKEIQVIELPNGFYDYNDDDVYRVINDSEDKSDETRIFEEIISMLYCSVMKMYSKRRKHKLKIVQRDLKNEIGL